MGDCGLSMSEIEAEGPCWGVCDGAVCTTAAETAHKAAATTTVSGIRIRIPLPPDRKYTILNAYKKKQCSLIHRTPSSTAHVADSMPTKIKFSGYAYEFRPVRVPAVCGHTHRTLFCAQNRVGDGLATARTPKIGASRVWKRYWPVSNSRVPPLFHSSTLTDVPLPIFCVSHSAANMTAASTKPSDGCSRPSGTTWQSQTLESAVPSLLTHGN
jgi:hypothetical protein